MDAVTLADPSACIVEHSILRAKVLDALVSNNAAMVLRRTIDDIVWASVLYHLWKNWLDNN